jgi:preprotein translocase subunit YajC
MAGILFIVPLFAVMYFVTIRPQQRRLQAQRALVRALEVGDEVVTVGGLIGRIVTISDYEILIDVGGPQVRMARSAVTGRTAEPPAL